MTTRTISAANEAEAAAGEVTPVIFANLDLTTGTVAAHTFVGSFTFGGDTYLGIGEFGSVEPIRETLAAKPVAVRLTLTGLDTGLLADMQLRAQYRRDVALYLGFVAGGELIDTPDLLWSGWIDSAGAAIDLEQGVVSVTCETVLADLRRGGTARATPEHQKLSYPSDTFFDFVAGLADKRVEWGETVVAPGRQLSPAEEAPPPGTLRP